MIPNVGTEVRVKVRNPSFKNVAKYAPGVLQEYETFVGTVYPSQKWQNGRKVLNLATTVRDFPFREIELVDIVSIDGVITATPQPRKDTIKVWTVQGSTGKEYTVTEISGKRSCTCVGFGYHGYCKHIK